MTTQVPNALLAFDGGALGFRNRLINGAMLVDQRNSGASQTFTAAAAIAYCVDRWYASCTGANVTGQRASAINGGYTFTGAASNTGTLFGQRIEGVNIADLVSTTVTGQVKLSSTSITSVTWTAYYANTQDTFSAKTQIATGTLTINSTPTVYSFSFNTGANAANGICIEFSTGALLAAQTITYGNVQLEAGPTLTPYERRPNGLELTLCLRYYFLWLNFQLRFYAPTNSNFTVYGSLPTPMRAVPSVVVGNVNYANGGLGRSITALNVRDVDWNYNASAAGDSSAIWANVSFTAEL